MQDSQPATHISNISISFQTEARGRDNLKAMPYFEELFQEVDPTCSLTTEAEELLSNLINASLEIVVKGSCKLALHRKSETLKYHDVLLFLKTQFDLDPIELTEGHYYALKTCDEVECSAPKKSKLCKSPLKNAKIPVPQKKVKRQSKKVRKKTEDK
ncbi:hypothetical protein JTE90_021569 [Oedothorax gibbosus]|uniref:Transcription initiation factor TFIID subunit 12 n=1 Tax=Oedothorax gibbosus TaxID=931172 RepID=A0AAV6VP42_9ARAC|nr:hypothetical protein JTE90_021569 [Oedothorax gibbosus]